MSRMYPCGLRNHTDLFDSIFVANEDIAEDEGFEDVYWPDFEERVKQCLPKSFYSHIEHVNNTGQKVIARNGLLDISLLGDVGVTGVFVSVRPEIAPSPLWKYDEKQLPLALRHLPLVIERIRNKLGYNVYVQDWDGAFRLLERVEK